MRNFRTAIGLACMIVMALVLPALAAEPKYCQAWIIHREPFFRLRGAPPAQEGAEGTIISSVCIKTLQGFGQGNPPVPNNYFTWTVTDAFVDITPGAGVNACLLNATLIVWMIKPDGSIYGKEQHGPSWTQECVGGYTTRWNFGPFGYWKTVPRGTRFQTWVLIEDRSDAAKVNQQFASTFVDINTAD